MTIRMLFCTLAAAWLLQPWVGAVAQPAGKTESASALQFAGTSYFHRFTVKDQHEYTPSGQEDLKAWQDMITLHYYRDAKTGEALASVANNVLGNYTAHKAKVIKTDSVPRTRDKPAEYLIVAAFGRPEFIELVFARLRMHEGMGTAVIYSRRMYGKNAGGEVNAWLQQNGEATEKALMRWDAMPKKPPA
jgi:hypothetical protein